MLAQIGITVNLDAQPKSLHFPKIENQTTDFYMLGWTPNTLDSADVFDYLIWTEGSWNAGGYSNAAIDDMLPAISSELDPGARRAMIHDAWDLILQDVAYVPLHNQVLTWAMREGLDMPITANNQPQFRWANFAE
jgi:peptide/nickel transport system substrate-binding protein